jgi:hypothetical protein
MAAPAVRVQGPPERIPGNIYAVEQGLAGYFLYLGLGHHVTPALKVLEQLC